MNMVYIFHLNSCGEVFVLRERLVNKIILGYFCTLASFDKGGRPSIPYVHGQNLQDLPQFRKYSLK